LIGNDLIIGDGDGRGRGMGAGGRAAFAGTRCCVTALVVTRRGAGTAALWDTIGFGATAA